MRDLFANEFKHHDIATQTGEHADAELFSSLKGARPIGIQTSSEDRKMSVYSDNNMQGVGLTNDSSQDYDALS